MKRILLFLIVSVMCGCGPVLAATVTGHAEVTLLEAIGLTETTVLDFGRIIPQQNSHVIVGSDQTRTGSGVVFVDDDYAAGVFTIVKTAGYDVNVSISGPANVKNPLNQKTLAISNMEATVSGDKIYVGGRCDIGTDTSPGWYTGTFEYRDWETDRKSTRLKSSHSAKSRMPSSA